MLNPLESLSTQVTIKYMNELHTGCVDQMPFTHHGLDTASQSIRLSVRLSIICVLFVCPIQLM